MTPEQMRMGRAALNLSMRDFAGQIGVTAAAICSYELGNEGKLSSATIDRAQLLFEKQRVFFGPKHGVCLGEDIFKTDRWYAAALFQLLKDSGHVPSSTELIEAGKRATASNANVTGLAAGKD